MDLFPTDPRQATVTSLLSAYSSARLIGDPALCGHLLALLRRAQNPITPEAAPGSVAAALWKERKAVQARGWENVVLLIDDWRSDSDDERSFEDICREVFLKGIDAGIDSIIPEWGDRHLSNFCHDLTHDSKEPAVS